MIEIHNFWSTMLTAISSGLILGHNLWLVAKRNDRSRGDEGGGLMRVEINTGHHFPAGESAVNPSRVADMQLVTANESTPLTGYQVEGTSLVVTAKNSFERAAIVALTLHPHPITLEPEKFKGYIEDEDALAAVAPRFTPGVTTQPQREIYTKYAKAFLAGKDEDDEIFRRVVNHKLEIVLERDPTIGSDRQLPVRVLFDGQPMAGVRVSSGGERVGNDGYAEYQRTDQDGRATLSITAPGRWYIRTHHIRLHPDERVADWESFWSSLTFQVG